MSAPIGTVNEEDLEAVLIRIRGLRVYALKCKLDPWAVRQGLLMALEMDTKAALDRGIKPRDLHRFDREATADIWKWMGPQK